MKDTVTKKGVIKPGLQLTPYVTKRVIVSSSKLAVQKAVAKAIKTAGYLIKAQDGWVVREEPNGELHRILKYKSSKHYPFALD
jgi:hypothetical protein